MSLGEETSVLDRARGQGELLQKEAHIQMTPAEEHFSQDRGLEIPGWWTTVMRRKEGRSNCHRPLISNDTQCNVWLYILKFSHYSSLSPWRRLKHSIETSARFSNLKVGIRELSFLFNYIASVDVPPFRFSPSSGRKLRPHLSFTFLAFWSEGALGVCA